MSPKKKQRGPGALTEAELAERSCSVCEVPVPGAYAWLDPATQQPCYGTEGEAERAVGQPRSKWAQGQGQPGEQPPHLNGGRRLAAPVARPRRVSRGRSVRCAVGFAC
jgi:hypothetical protein